MKKVFFLLLLLPSLTFAQNNIKPNQLWHLSNESNGINADRAYEFLKDKTSREIIVAVIDGGTDINHPDLKGKIWVNTKEIAGNGKDDDNNGYIDDINGWNFIGGPNGKNVAYDTKEETRIYRELRDNPNAEVNGYTIKDVKPVIDKEIKFAKSQMPALQLMTKNLDSISIALNTENPTKDEIEAYQPNSRVQGFLKTQILESAEKGIDFKQYKADIIDYNKHLTEMYMFHYEPDFDDRKLVGDNPNNIKECCYGNNDVKGPDSDHGTHVAGIIGSIRDNELGASGVAENIKLMIVRVVPNGDERDKDVANGIRYAADNGAHIINMSFGKSFSVHPEIVQEAILYAKSKGVLMIHAAGNDNNNLDKASHYPNVKGINASDYWLEVGALSWKSGKETVATFSNYGKKSVDVTAPGVDIYSTIPEGQYSNHDGTSMAAPVVAGMAAVIMGYYPNLTPAQVKQLLISSSIPIEGKVIVPGSRKKRSMKKIAVSGGVVNLYNAVRNAAKM